MRHELLSYYYFCAFCVTSLDTSNPFRKIPEMGFTCNFPNCGFQASTSWIIKGHERYCNMRECVNDMEQARRGRREGSEMIIEYFNGENGHSICEVVDNDDCCELSDEGFGNNDDITSSTTDTDGQRKSMIRAVETLAVNISTMEGVAGTNSLNQLIENICDPEFSLSLFKERIRNVSDCKGVCKDIVRRHFSSNGFKEVRINDDSGKFISTLYCRDPIELLRQQTKQVESSTFILTTSNAVSDTSWKQSTGDICVQL